MILKAWMRKLNLLYKKSLTIRPEIHPWGFTNEELKKASSLTTLGEAYRTGIRF